MALPDALSDMEHPCLHPESRVLIIATGGTICMQPTPDGLQPMGGFLESAMAPRPCFNDKSSLQGKLPLFLYRPGVVKPPSEKKNRGLTRHNI